MVVTIVAILGIFLLFAVIGGAYFIYSLINSKNNMNGDTKAKALDVFVYLGIGITLVVSVYNLLQILFTAIDRKFVDVLSSSYMDVYNSDMRMAVAFLVVMYPLYLILSWYTAKDIAKFLYKRDLTIRKVMIYTTIFITVCSIIGTLVSIIYTYLGGELSVRFAYKALSVFVVSLGVFGYYFYSVRRDYSVKSSIPVMATIVATVVVVASLVWSISIVGTPSEMRAKRMDGTRLLNISSIQQQIFSRFQTTDKLPLKLEELNDAFANYAVPIDPSTKESYVYKVVQQPVMKFNYTTNKKEMASNAIFQLCATFETTRNVNNNGAGYKNLPIMAGLSSTDISYSISNYYYDGDQTPFWNHGVGETCFKRIISPDMYYGK
ncbi:TPA: hypothetical protein DEP94_00970 [Candidatus Nomurabacteria bacterium]|nr:hypothetical protein [Candidatus Nomurabacteria bacterium]